MDEQLIDRIYECSFVPELWPGVLDELARNAGARGGFLFTANTGVVNWTASDSIRGGLERFVRGDYYLKGQRAVRAIATRHAGFLTEHDVYRPDELQTDPIYRDLLWPAGLGWCAATVIPAPTGDVLFLSVERERTRGPVEQAIVQQLDALRPHLARSALMSARLQLERMRAATETLELIGLPALIFDRTGKVRSANHLIEALTDFIYWQGNDRFSFKDVNADVLLRGAVDTVGVEEPFRTRSFAVRAAEGGAAMVAHVLPIRRSVRDIFVHCSGTLVMTPVALPQAPPVELVQSLFDLSPAEARVARHLVAGSTVDEIASIDGVSSNTVRTQVRGVLEKTGCRRQTEVVALFSGVALSRG